MSKVLALRGLWPFNLALLAGLGPLVVFSLNLNRMMVETLVIGIAILFAILLVLRFALVLAVRHPAWTDPLLVLVVLAGFYNSFFASDSGTPAFWLWLAIFILPIVLVAVSPRARAVLPKVTLVFLAIVNVLVLVDVVQYEGWSRRAELRAMLDAHYPPLAAGGTGVVTDRPDIYYLVFDRYARADQLAVVYEFDNSGFIDALRARGFQVSDGAYGAYQRTAHSLGSTLNLDYLPALDGVPSNDWVPLYERLRAPRLYGFLTSEGYRIVTMGSWWEPTRTSGLADSSISYFAVPESLRAMVEGSALLRGLDGLGLDWLDPRRRQCERIKYKFEALADLGSDDRPVFAFAHFLVPHPPFVIDADGRCKSVDETRALSRRDNYIAQLRYANGAILDLIDGLIARDPEAVIVLQSDEGPWPERYAGDEITDFGGDVTSVDWRTVPPDELREKIAILAAMRLPGRPSAVIADDFSPVNTFRIILREYFGQPLPDLEPRTWVFENDASLWRYRDVGDDLR